MADYGIKVVTAGTSVASTTPTDYILNSSYGAVKVITEPPNKTYGTIGVAAAAAGTVFIEHNQSFAPLVLWFTELKPGSGHWYMGGCPDADPTDASGAVDTYYGASYADQGSIAVKYFNNTASSLTVKYYYFIFGDSGE